MRRELINVVNLQDKMMNTALHYATQLWPQEVVRYVLELGANIGVKNVYDEVQIENIIVIHCIQPFKLSIECVMFISFFEGSNLTYFT